MKRWPTRMTVALLVSTLAACGGDRDDDAIPPDEVVPQVPEPTRPPPVYDAEGRLLPSERVLGGVALPRGLGEPEIGAGRHLFSTSIPAGKLVQYFGPRLFTGRVERNGAGASFYGATPLQPQGDPSRMDVMIIAVSPHESRLMIRVAAPVGTTAPPASEGELRAYHERLD